MRLPGRGIRNRANRQWATRARADGRGSIKKCWRIALSALGVLGALASIAAFAFAVFIHTSDPDDNSSWVYTAPVTTNGDSATLEIMDLEPCTNYEVQASLDPYFRDGSFTTFKTLCEQGPLDAMGTAK